MMSAKQQADFKRCANFIAEMIAKYGAEVLDDVRKENESLDNENTAA